MSKKKRSQPTVLMNWDNILQYGVAVIVTAATVWLVYRYAAIRYGVEGLSSLNKSLATSTMFLLGIVLLLGPLSRLFTLFDHAFKYRKELGVLTFFTGAAHVYLSMFPLARRGPWGFYASQPLSAYAGLAGLIIMFILLLLSAAAVERTIGTRLWWKLQYWGARLAFIAVAFHMIVLKYSGWGLWFSDRTILPPLALLATVFVTFVLVVRVSELFGPRAARAITQAFFLITIGLTVWLFF